MVQGGLGVSASKKLHPFFSRSNNNGAIETPADTQSFQHSAAVSREPAVDLPDDTNRNKRRKVDDAAYQEDDDAANPKTVTLASEAESTTEIPSPNSEGDMKEAGLDSQSVGNSPVAEAITASSKTPKPKKVLKFNPSTGTLGSPPKPKVQPKPSRLVSIKYGHDDESRRAMGEKIGQILDGSPKAANRPRRGRPARASNKHGTGSAVEQPSAKVTHPLFAGKAEPSVDTTNKDTAPSKKSSARRQSVFMSTPVSPKKPRVPFNSHPVKVPQFGFKSSGTKIPGAMLPLWPARGMSHVRGEDLGLDFAVSDYAAEMDSGRKSKGQVVVVHPGESVIGRLARQLNPTQVAHDLPRDEDKFEPAPPELRLPERHFESGRNLQKRTRRQLWSNLAAYGNHDRSSSPDELLDEPRDRSHPVIRRWYTALATGLSAYDQSTCENLSWTQKYAPGAAAQVLQIGKEARLLKEWLQALEVLSVDTGSATSEGPRPKGKSESIAKRKRRKTKLDGFIVDSDEEADEMDEISDDEEAWSASGSGALRKTVIRAGDILSKGSKDQRRCKNAIVMSGPHGCGKTAAVYAVAKELDFEVFEINSSSRRSGKDLLDRVGDMTRNHLVQQHKADETHTDDEEDEVANDIKAGKQGMMTSFFKPKPTTQGKKQSRPKSDSAHKATAGKSQKQSLILLEEVDVLYEEDKQFWTTLMTMITQSKRPFVMTCSDESMLPIQSLELHGIFRFSAPPTDLAVDLCLLIAANEGHALQRSAVEALYASRGFDLRATIIELNYWCQIGIGDRRGGFDWFYLRWPKGSDLDDQGDVVRVISEDTYRKGMNWFGRDPIATAASSLDAEQEALAQSWGCWAHDTANWEDTIDMDTWAHTIAQPKTKEQDIVEGLCAYDDFCTSMSDADLCSSQIHACTLGDTVDPTLPEMPSKMRDDFIVGYSLLEVDSLASFASPSREISMSIKSYAREGLYHFAKSKAFEEASAVVEPVTEDDAIAILDSNFRRFDYPMTRRDLSLAFDPLAVSEKSTSSQLDMSIFDRTIRLLVEDVAPWVRSIVAFDYQLMEERLKLSNLLSEGGKRKRMRNTRAAYSALEGGERKTTRRERYFGDALTTGFVMRTGGDSWQDALAAVERPECITDPMSSPDSDV